MVFHNGSNYHYHCIIKKLAKAFEREFICVGESTEKCNIFSAPITKEVKRIEKSGEKLYKLYLTYYSLSTTSGLWQVHYQILLIILLKEFIELNVNMGMIIKSFRHVELNTKVMIVVLNTQTLKMI